MVRHENLIAPEIAERHGYSIAYVQRRWMTHPAWPSPAGKRGKWHEYDTAAVDEWVRGHIERETPEPTGGPDDLLTVQDIADYTNLSHRTVRADVSRGRWPAPDDEQYGVKRWRRATVDEVMMRRRPYRRRES